MLLIIKSASFRFFMHAAYFVQENNKVRCRLCPHYCLLSDGKTGICRVRRNVSGTLQVETYGRVSSIHLDPVEKKPLYHFYPGHHILSVGSVGCNMHCSFCQNCDISQVGARDYLEEYPVTAIVKEALDMNGNLGVAFTYNEPVINYEFVMDVSHALHAEGLKTVLKTNGYINEKPLEELLPYIDAFNVDLKSFTEPFYQKQAKAHLEPVKNTLIALKKHRKHLEITHLVIPGLNDSFEEFEALTDWISYELGSQTVLHISRYFPKYKLTRPSTPESTLEAFYKIARNKLAYVYLGNVGRHLPGHDTTCPGCRAVAIKRVGYSVDLAGIDNQGNCKSCGYNIVRMESKK